MSIAPGPLLTVQGSGDPAAAAQTNFEELASDFYGYRPTRVSGIETTLIGPPTAAAHILNERWVDAYGAAWRCTVAGTPGTWRQETPAVRAGEPSSGTIPTGYVILDSNVQHAAKYHAGGYVWRSVAGRGDFGELTGLTGGGTANLDGVVSTALALGTTAQFYVAGRLVRYRLRSGTNAELSPWIVRPDDYATTTNERVWERVAWDEYPGTVIRETTGLTGGATTDLNGIPTVDLAVGTTVEFLVSGVLMKYRLRTGLEATASPTLIRPVDFQSVTNPKVWELLLTVETPGDVMLASNDLNEINTEAKREQARDNLAILSEDSTVGALLGRGTRGGLSGSSDIIGPAGLSLSVLDFTVAFTLWRPTWDLDAETIIFYSHYGSGVNYFHVGIDEDVAIFVRFKNAAGVSTKYTMTPDVPFEDGATYQVVVTVDRDGLAKLFVNGQWDRDRTGAGPQVDVSAEQLVDVGRNNTDVWRSEGPRSGVLHSLLVFNFAMTDAEVLGLSRRETSVKSATLADGWRWADVMEGTEINGGFETAGGGGADVLANWTEATSGTSAISRDTVDFLVGAASAKFVIDGSNSNASLTQANPNIALNPLNFTFIVWAKADSTSGSPNFTINGASHALTTSYAPYRDNFTDLGSAADFIIARGSGCTSRTLNFDAASIHQIGCLIDLDIEGAVPAHNSTVSNRNTNATSPTVATNTVQVARDEVVNARALTVGASTKLLKLLSATATLDFGSIAAAATGTLTITVTGALVGDAVAIGLPSSPAAGIVFYGYVSATNTVTIRAMNITGSAVDPASGTYRATVFQF